MMEFVRLEYKNSPPGSAELLGHQEVINDYASNGYTYVGFIPVKLGPSGKILIIDLIFKKTN
jgi:hypothetical protein